MNRFVFIRGVGATIMRAFSLLLVLACLMCAGSAAAHEPDTYSVIVREDTHSPDAVTVLVNDTVQYIHRDNRSNATHQIGVDYNGDGDFDDENEFGSPVLTRTCDWDNDSDCRVAWKFIINDTAYAGEYDLVDIITLENGTVEHIWISLTIELDNHIENAPPIGECFGAGCDEEPEEVVAESFASNPIFSAGMVMMAAGGLLLISGMAGKSH